MVTLLFLNIGSRSVRRDFNEVEVPEQRQSAFHIRESSLDRHRSPQHLVPSKSGRTVDFSMASIDADSSRTTVHARAAS